jgi:UTP:GlnB (protein PII) uridylyltransferase
LPATVLVSPSTARPTPPPPSLPLQTRTARHKIAKFLRQHAALAVSKGLVAPGDSGLVPLAAPTDWDGRQTTWLIMQCDDRPGLLAEVANVIARHQHNITVSGAGG